MYKGGLSQRAAAKEIVVKKEMPGMLGLLLEEESAVIIIENSLGIANYKEVYG